MLIGFWAYPKLQGTVKSRTRPFVPQRARASTAVKWSPACPLPVNQPGGESKSTTANRNGYVKVFRIGRVRS
eukprot:30940-Pelagococcus_subviridis.AAC.4